MTRGWIGVQIQSVTQDIADSLGLKQAEGALVTEPQSDGPARCRRKSGQRAGRCACRGRSGSGRGQALCLDADQVRQIDTLCGDAGGDRIGDRHPGGPWARPPLRLESRRRRVRFRSAQHRDRRATVAASRWTWWPGISGCAIGRTRCSHAIIVDHTSAAGVERSPSRIARYGDAIDLVPVDAGGGQAPIFRSDDAATFARYALQFHVA